MRHYEIVVMVHPDQSDQVPAMVERYRAMVAADNGAVHRFEDWGRRQLAYTINGLHKAHYFLLNIECDGAALDEIKEAFRFNDAVLRHLMVRKNRAVTAPSPLFKSEEDKDDKKEERTEARDEESDETDDDQDGDDAELTGETDNETDEDTEKSSTGA